MRYGAIVVSAAMSAAAPAVALAQHTFGNPCPPAVDVERRAEDNVLLGVERAWGFYWLTGAGHSRHGGDPEYRRIYQFDLQWSLVAQYRQASASPWFAGRDPAALEDENLLLVGAEDGELVTYAFDPLTRRLDLRVTSVQKTDVPGVTRGLAYHQARGTLFTKDFEGEIVEFDLAGRVVNTWAVPAISAYGAAYDPLNDTIWFNAYDTVWWEFSNSRLVEWDPATGAATGREILTVDSWYGPPAARKWIPGGLDIVLNGDQLLFVMLMQGDPFDFVSLVLGDGSGGCPRDCYPDCDGSGDLDVFDFLCFQSAFAAAEPYADCDGSGTFEFFDFLCFQNAFAAGCP